LADQNCLASRTAPTRTRTGSKRFTTPATKSGQEFKTYVPSPQNSSRAMTSRAPSRSGMTSRAPSQGAMPSQWGPVSRISGFQSGYGAYSQHPSGYSQQPEEAVVMVPNPDHPENKEETKSNICCIVLTIIGLVVVALFGLWAVWYFGIRKQPDTTGKRSSTTPHREKLAVQPKTGGNGTGIKLTTKLVKQPKTGGNGTGNYTVPKRTHPSTDTGRWRYKEDGQWIDYNAACQLTITKMRRAGIMQFTLRTLDGERLLSRPGPNDPVHNEQVIVWIDLQRKEQHSCTGSKIWPMQESMPQQCKTG